MRIAIALPGLHRTPRGAEVAFTALGVDLARRGHEVTLFGSGPQREGVPYRYVSAPVVSRERFERFPMIPALRNDTAWEELSFMPGFLRRYRPADFDVTLTCSYPFLNWALRTRRQNKTRPAHVFITQNGDWPARANNSEFRYFGCDGLVCTNPEFFEANKERYRSALIPNGVDLSRFVALESRRSDFGLPAEVPIVLMVSALIESKFVDRGIEAISKLPGVHLAVAGDGPMRDALHKKAEALMPGRYHNFTTTPDRMPTLYSSADLFMHLSRDESFGNVYIEAMACGLKTVAWDLPNTRWITGETGYLVNGEDIGSLSSGIAEALADEADVQKLRDRAKLFSWANVGRQYETFLVETVGRR